MAMHNTNSLLKYVVPGIIFSLLILVGIKSCHSTEPVTQKSISHGILPTNSAAQDSAAESLDTLTAELKETRDKINEVSKTNETLKKENTGLADQLNSKQNDTTRALTNDIQQLKTQFQALTKPEQGAGFSITGVSHDVITTVPDLTQAQPAQPSIFTDKTTESKNQPLPYYTIPANGTSVKDRLMTALVGRIPVKGVVTDPYPFKIVISDDNLAANGLRIPHLLQMIVSGYCEGDLNLLSVRGWVTSLTFVFDDGTISTTTSNDNDIGNFTKANSLGYLSDKFGNPFIRGKLISNAPAYLAGNVALGAVTGAANAYAESQTTSHDSLLGNATKTITGSQGKFLAGQATTNAAKEAQEWWHDREEQSFDAIYVSPTAEQNKQIEYIEIAVNFAKEIHIDYDPKGRKLNYAHSYPSAIHPSLD